MLRQQHRSINAVLRVVVVLAGFGAALTFVGHGMLAAQKDETLVNLLNGSLRFWPGDGISFDTVERITQVVGIFDVMVGLVISAMTVGLLTRNTLWQRLATSKVMVVLLVWAIFWQCITSMANIVATGDFFPGIWNMLERSPSFLLPLSGLLALLYLRASREN